MKQGEDLRKLKRFLADRETQKQYLVWLFRYSKPYLPRILFTMCVSVSTTVIGVGTAVISKHVIDAVTNGGAYGRFLVYYILITFAMLGLGAFMSLFSAMLTEKYTFGIRKQVYDKLLRSVWIDTQRFHTGDLMTRMTSDAGNIADGMISVIPGIITLCIQLVIVFVTFFHYSRLLAVAALFLSPVAALICLVLGRKLKRYQVKVQESEAAYRSFIQESLANLLVVKSFANEDRFSEKLVALREERFSWVYKKTKLNMMVSTSMSAAFQVGYFIAFAYGAYLIARGDITYGTMTVFLTLFARIQSPVMQLSQQIPSVVSVLASAGRVMELQELQEEAGDPIPAPVKGLGVSAECVSFGYAEDTVLKDVSFDIQPGEFVALVGDSGIGKTTLIRLLLCFVKPDRGLIRYGDGAGNVFPNAAAIRQYVSYVPQGNTLFSGTIRDNLLMGKVDASDAELNDALQAADCTAFIGRLPDGLDTKIGEKGAGLSEGQAQRIAIARALIRRSPFVIMDEATSALDEETELRVLDGIRAHTSRPTCLLITHRMSVLHYCGRAFRIRGGVLTAEAVASELGPDNLAEAV